MNEFQKSIASGIEAMVHNESATIITPNVPEKVITLSDEQKAIVESDANNIIVAAGAGSGKTRVLIERIKYLLDVKQVDASNIVAITFTNMAADEMRERLCDVRGIGDAFIGTIHAFANRIFRNADLSYEIYSDAKDSELHKELIDKYCKFLTYFKYLQYKDLRSKAEMGIIPEDRVKSFLMPSEKAELSELHKATSKQFPETIVSLCRKRNIITFDQLLDHASKYFKSIGAEIEYVLVDEFQDVGTLEYNFIKSLNAKNYFFVGDDWQSIYGFKGGNVNIFKSLISDKRFVKYYLQDNYRSGSEILKVAKQVIHQVPGIIEKKVVNKSGKTGSVKLDNKYHLQSYLENIRLNGKYGDWFILVRSNREVYQYSELMTKLHLPFSTFKRADLSLAEMRAEMAKDTVKLLTIHTAKGLESPNVLVVGNFPLKQPNYQRNSDERKVFYVAITRAMNQLIILN